MHILLHAVLLQATEIPGVYPSLLRYNIESDCTAINSSRIFKILMAL